jgi:hypothetical protein
VKKQLTWPLILEGSLEVDIVVGIGKVVYVEVMWKMEGESNDGKGTENKSTCYICSISRSFTPSTQPGCFGACRF